MSDPLDFDSTVLVRQLTMAAGVPPWTTRTQAARRVVYDWITTDHWLQLEIDASFDARWQFGSIADIPGTDIIYQTANEPIHPMARDLFRHFKEGTL